MLGPARGSAAAGPARPSTARSWGTFSASRPYRALMSFRLRRQRDRALSAALPGALGPWSWSCRWSRLRLWPRAALLGTLVFRVQLTDLHGPSSLRMCLMCPAALLTGHALSDSSGWGLESCSLRGLAGPPLADQWGAFPRPPGRLRGLTHKGQVGAKWPLNAPGPAPWLCEESGGPLQAL